MKSTDINIPEMEKMLDIWHQRAKRLSYYSDHCKDFAKKKRSNKLALTLLIRVSDGLIAINKYLYEKNEM